MTKLFIVTLICRAHYVKLWLDDLQAGIKISRRNVNNHLRYADNTTLMVESEEELKRELLQGEGGE